MNRAALAGLAILGLGFTAYAIASRQTESGEWVDEYGNTFDPFAFDVAAPLDLFGSVDSGVIRFPVEDSMHPLLQLIRRYESNHRYNVVFGGATFSDDSIHPFATRALDGRDGEFTRRGIAPARITRGSNRGRTSTAAGAYQFLVGTWRSLRDRTGIEDFSPASQDTLALQYLRQRGALAAYNRGDLPGAVRIAARAWTSLPTSSTGEAALSLAEAVAFLESAA